jgi:VWFA-related protein
LRWHAHLAPDSRARRPCHTSPAEILDHTVKERMIRNGPTVMISRRLTYSILSVLAIIHLCALSSSLLFAQEPPREKPKLKNFGSSLKRIKWDPKANAAVENRRKDKTTTANADDDDVIRVETSLVVCDVLILDQHGQNVSSLTKDDFIVTEDAAPQEVGVFSLGDNTKVGRSIVLLIDYSGSQLPFINTSIAAAKTLVDKLSPLDRMAIVTDDVELLLDFTTNKKKLKDKLEYLRKRSTAKLSVFANFNSKQFGRSNQYSALMATLKEAFNSEDERPIIIFQTDGDEAMLLRDPIIRPYVPRNLSPEDLKRAEASSREIERIQRLNVREFSLKDVYKQVETSRATIYTVVPGFRLLGLSPDEQLRRIRTESELRIKTWSETFGDSRIDSMRRREQLRWAGSPDVLNYEIDTEVKTQSTLAEVADISGGWTSFLEEPSQADEIYSHIFSDINRRYIIGYYPTNKNHDGKRRKVNIEVRGHPEYSIMGRKSYLAPEPE